MFFILSKTVNFLTTPLVIIVLLLIASVLVKKEALKRRLFWSGLGLLLLGSNAFIANEAMKLWEVSPVPFESVIKKYKVAVVLSGVVQGDTELKDRAFLGKAGGQEIGRPPRALHHRIFSVFAPHDPRIDHFDDFDH